jgi:hypothetical protein
MAHTEWITTTDIDFDPMDFAMARDDGPADLVQSLREQYTDATFTWRDDAGVTWLTIQAGTYAEIMKIIEEAIGSSAAPIMPIVVEDKTLCSHENGARCVDCGALC